MPELGLTGDAILTDIQTTPRIEAPLDSRDDRQVVTATFHHSSGDVIDLVVENPNDQSQMTNEVVDIGEGNKGNGGVLDSRLRGNDELAESGEPKAEIAGRESEISDFKSPPCDFPITENLKPKTSGEAETIGTTSNHPFWSEDRQEFVQAGSLEIGERLQTLSGDVKVVQQKLPRPGPQPVFNVEVHDEHVYFVGEDGVLVHNAKVYLDDALAYSGQNIRSQLGTSGKMEVRVGRAGLAGDHVLPQKAISNAMARAGVAESSTAGKLVLGIQDSARNLRLMDSKLNSSKWSRNAIEFMSTPLGSKMPRNYIQNILRKQYKNATEINVHLNGAAGTKGVDYFSDFWGR